MSGPLRRPTEDELRLILREAHRLVAALEIEYYHEGLVLRGTKRLGLRSEKERRLALLAALGAEVGPEHYCGEYPPKTVYDIPDQEYVQFHWNSAHLGMEDVFIKFFVAERFQLINFKPSDFTAELKKSREGRKR